LPCGPPRERCYLAMAPPTHTGPGPLPVPPQSFAEPLFSVLPLLPRLFGLENSWKYSSKTTLLLIQSMHLSPALTHLVYVISSPLSCGSNPVSFPVLARAIRIPNLSTEPRTLKCHEHFCQVTPVFEPKEESPTSQSPTQRPLPPSHASHSASVQVDPDRILPEAVRANFQSPLSEYDSVFDLQFPGYNGSAGPYQAKVNMGPVEPP